MNGYAIPAISILGTLGVALVGIIIKRLYGSIDILFQRIEALQKRVNNLELAALKADPESSMLFRTFTK